MVGEEDTVTLGRYRDTGGRFATPRTDETGPPIVDGVPATQVVIGTAHSPTPADPEETSLANYLFDVAEGRLSQEQATCIINAEGPTNIEDIKLISVEDMMEAGVKRAAAKGIVQRLTATPEAPDGKPSANDNGSKYGVKWPAGLKGNPSLTEWEFYFGACMNETDSIKGGKAIKQLAKKIKKDVHGMSDETRKELKAATGTEADKFLFQSMVYKQSCFPPTLFQAIPSEATDNESGLLLLLHFALKAETSIEMEVKRLRSTIYDPKPVEGAKMAEALTEIENNLNRLESHHSKKLDHEHVLDMIETKFLAPHKDTEIFRCYHQLKDERRRENTKWELAEALKELKAKSIDMQGTLIPRAAAAAAFTPAAPGAVTPTGGSGTQQPRLSQLCLSWIVNGKCSREQEIGHVDRFLHPPERQGSGIRDDEVRDWTKCTRDSCPESGLSCAFKHGDGSQQIMAQRAKGGWTAVAKKSRKKNTEVGALTAALAAAKRSEAAAKAAVQPPAYDSPTAAQMASLQASLQAQQAELASMQASKPGAVAMAAQGAAAPAPSEATTIRILQEMNDLAAQLEEGDHNPAAAARQLTCCALQTSKTHERGWEDDILVDGGSNVIIVGRKHRGACRNVRKLSPSEQVAITTVGGQVLATHSCDVMTAAGVLVNGLYVPEVDDSLVSVKSLCEVGYTYVQDLTGARLLKGDQVLQLADDGTGLFHMRLLRASDGPASAHRVAVARLATAVAARLTAKIKASRCCRTTCRALGDRPATARRAAVTRLTAAIKLKADRHRLAATRKAAVTRLLAAAKLKASRRGNTEPCCGTTCDTPGDRLQATRKAVVMRLLAAATTRAQLRGRPKLAQTETALKETGTWGKDIDFDLPTHIKNKHSPWSKHCFDCVMAALQSRPATRRQKEDGIAGEEFGWVISEDMKGPLAADLRGFKWAAVLVEASSGYGGIRFMKSKASGNTLAALQEFIAEMRLIAGAASKVLIRTHTDDGKEFIGELKSWLRQSGIATTSTGGYRAKANPIVERRIKSLLQASRAMMLTCAGGDDSYYEDLWALSMECASHAINVTPREATGISPYEALTGKPWIRVDQHDHPFGALALYHTPKETRRNNLEPPARIGIWAGADTGVVEGHQVVPISYDYEAQRWVLHPVITATTARIYDKVFPLRLGSPSKDETKLSAFMERFQPWLDTPEIPDAVVDAGDVADGSGVYEVEAIVDMRTRKRQKEYLIKWKGYSGEANTWEPRRKLTNHGGSGILKRFEESRKVSKGASAATPTTHSCPTHEDIVHRLLERDGVDVIGAEIDDWVMGYDKEVTAMVDRRLDELHGEEAEHVRRRRLAVRMRMVLRAKRDGRKKGRLVLQGFMEPRWWHTGPTDSPVVAMSTIKTIVFMAGNDGDVLSSVDIDVAFLQADEFDPSEPTRYCSYKPHPDAVERFFRMRGPIYGSRDAGMRFYKTVLPWLESQGFVMALNDPAAFRHPDTGLIIGMHVDDLLVRGSLQASKDFYAALENKFDIKAPSYLTPQQPMEFVGMRVTMEESEGGYLRYIDCSEATEALVDSSGLGTARTLKCPMPDTKEIASDPQLLDEAAGSKYRSTVGSLNYLVAVTRYDLAHAASRLGQFSAAPTVGAAIALRRVIAYLASTVDFRIGGGFRETVDSYGIYSDSDHAGDKVLGTRSQSGIIITLNGVPVYWRSVKQPKTSTSPAAAEIHALSDTVQHARLFLWRCEELGMQVQWPMRIGVDNKQADSFSRATCLESRLRGIFDLRDAWVRELRDAGLVRTIHVPGIHNPADLLTKCLASGPFNRMVTAIRNGMRFPSNHK